MIKHFNVEVLDNTGLVKTIYTSNVGSIRWKIYSKDEDKQCFKYYEELASLFGVNVNDIVRVNQKHTDDIKIVHSEDRGLGVTKDDKGIVYDGLITNEKNIILSTVEADCVPVYMLDTKNKAIGMIHSGWRSTAKKITKKAIDMMKNEYNTKEEDLLIYLGPSICKNCYEVREDVLYDFLEKFSKENILKIFLPKNNINIIERISKLKQTNFEFTKENENNKYLLDVSKAVEITLLEKGIKKENIYKSKYCTYHDDNLFDSYRKNKDKAGHILTAIMLK